MIDLSNSDHVVKNAALECNKGSAVTFFNPTGAVGTETGTGKQGIKTDGRASNIVGNFGSCSGNQNKPCEKAVSGEWYNTSRSSYYSMPSHQVLENDLHKLVNDISANPTLSDALTNATRETPPSTFSNNSIQLHLCSKEQYNYLQRRINEINKLENALKSIQVDNNNDKKLKDQLILRAQALKLFTKTLRFSPSQSFSTVQIPYLIIDSKLPCPKYMGVISVFRGKEGQILESESHDDPLADLRERVKEVIRKHYDVGTPEPSDDENAPQTAEEQIIANLTESLDGRDNPAQDAQTIMTGLNAGKSKRQLQAEQTAARNDGRTSDVSRLEGEINELNVAITAKEAIMGGLNNTEASLQVKILVHSAEIAEKTIEELEIDAETDALKLLAWLVLLNEDDRWTNEESENAFYMENAIETVREEVTNNEYNDYGINFENTAPIGTEVLFKFTTDILRNKIDDCKKDAYALPVQNPLLNGKPTWNYSQWEPNYTMFGGHTGIDFGPRNSMSVVASFSGTICTVIANYGYSQSPSFGNQANIETCVSESSYTIKNCHLADGDNSIVVRVNQFVLAGKYLGVKGNTGTLLYSEDRGYYQMSPHLHYEVQENGSHVDPNYTFLPDNVSSHDAYNGG